MNTLPLVSGIVWEGYGTFRRWNLAGASASLGAGWVCTIALLLVSPLCEVEVCSLSSLHLLPCVVCHYEHLAPWNHKS